MLMNFGLDLLHSQIKSMNSSLSASLYKLRRCTEGFLLMNSQHRRKQHKYVTDIDQRVGNGGPHFFIDHRRLHLSTHVNRQKIKVWSHNVLFTIAYHFTLKREGYGLQFLLSVWLFAVSS